MKNGNFCGHYLWKKFPDVWHQLQLDLGPQGGRVAVPRLRVAEGALDPLRRPAPLAVDVAQEALAVAASYLNLHWILLMLIHQPQGISKRLFPGFENM